VSSVLSAVTFQTTVLVAEFSRDKTQIILSFFLLCTSTNNPLFITLPFLQLSIALPSLRRIFTLRTSGNHIETLETRIFPYNVLFNKCGF
jgi:hypothetical protein